MIRYYSLVRLDVEPDGVLLPQTELSLVPTLSTEQLGVAGFDNRIVMSLSLSTTILSADTLARLGELPSGSRLPLCNGTEIILPDETGGIEFYDLAGRVDSPPLESAAVNISQTSAQVAASGSYVFRLGFEPITSGGIGASETMILNAFRAETGGGIASLWRSNWPLVYVPAPQSIAAAGEFVYVATMDDLQTHNAATGTVTDAIYGTGYYKVVANDGLLAASGYNSLAVYRLDDPSSPQLTHTLAAEIGERVRAIAGTTVYTTMSNTVKAYDFAQENPVPTITPRARPVRDFAVEGTIGYALINGSAGDFLITFSLDDPLAPEPIASLPLPTACLDVQVIDGVAYLGSANLGVLAVSVASPASPVLIGSEYIASLEGVAVSPTGVFAVTKDRTWRLPPSCSGIVPTFLSGFAAAPTADRVEINWRVGEEVDAPHFRLDAATNGIAWTVPCAAAGRGFIARDAAALQYAPCRVTYTLNYETDGEWLALAELALDLDAPARRTRLLAPWPNPFNPAVEISYETDRPGRVRVQIFDVAGRRIADLVDEQQDLGAHRTKWNGRDRQDRPVPAGTYFARLTTERTVSTQKLQLIK